MQEVEMQEVERVSGDGSRLERFDSGAARRWAIASRAAFATHRGQSEDRDVARYPLLLVVT